MPDGHSGLLHSGTLVFLPNRDLEEGHMQAALTGNMAIVTVGADSRGTAASRLFAAEG